ncbi:MAG: 3'-5' exonuclease, partial [Gammaproteobacteria bacterium]
GAALEEILSEAPQRLRRLNALAARVGLVERTTKQLDWRKEIMEAASAARANDMAPDVVRGFAGPSADELIALLPAPVTGRDLDAELLGAVNHAIAEIDTVTDTTKTTREYVESIRGVRAGLLQHRLTWAEWVGLSKQAPGAKNRAHAEPIRLIAGEFEKHPRLHADIRELIGEVFDLAAASIEAYQRIKEQQGLLDFVDQEQRVHALLEHPHVKATLDDELEVLFVDEFQDTSPIQLALFMKLAALADRVVWVGDVKQAIYGFRGSDPELMQAVLAGVTAGGGASDVLEHSWRSRASLVEYVNELFVPAFASTLPRRQVELTPKRKPRAAATDGDPAVITWHLEGRNRDRRASDIAWGIHRLIASGYRVEDKASGKLYAAGYGDIAVLCRTNDRLRKIAAACAQAGIPVAFRRPGLLRTPEGALAMAALRRLADARDSLASAEIRTLTRCESPEGWLGERLAFVADCDDMDAPSWRWGEAGEDAIPALAALAAVREERSLVTPSEALEAALVSSRVRESAIAWGPTPDRTRHRLRNVDLLLHYAATYEDQCDMQSVAASLPGLILWLRDLAARGEDWQAEAADGRAVTLVTHHGAKGLEWPVVIAVDLDSDVKPRLWGLSVLQREGGFDIEEPLVGRRLRYWPWPFGLQSAGIPLANSAADSAAGQAAYSSAVEETRRLLYVALTRARDGLVLALPAKKPTGEWIQTLGADWMLPAGAALELPSGVRIPTAFESLDAPEEWVVPAPDEQARWVRPGITGSVIAERNLSPSSAPPIEGAHVTEIFEYGERLEITGAADMKALGEALHTIIAAEINAPEDDAASRTARILKEWGLGGVIDARAALEQARQFVLWVSETFRPLAWHVEHPVACRLPSGQVAQGFIDLLLETAKGPVIIDHKASPRPRAQWPEVAQMYSGQIEIYRTAVESATKETVAGTLLNFTVGGGVASIATRRHRCE